MWHFPTEALQGVLADGFDAMPQSRHHQEMRFLLRRFYYEWSVLAAVAGLNFANGATAIGVLTVFMIPLSRCCCRLIRRSWPMHMRFCMTFPRAVSVP